MIFLLSSLEGVALWVVLSLRDGLIRESSLFFTSYGSMERSFVLFFLACANELKVSSFYVWSENPVLCMVSATLMLHWIEIGAPRMSSTSVSFYSAMPKKINDAPLILGVSYCHGRVLCRCLF